MQTTSHRTEFIPVANMDDAIKAAPWAFKIIKFEDGFMAFDGPMASHLFKLKRKQF